MVLGFSSILPNTLIISVSLFVLVYGAEELIKSLTAIAKKYGVSDVFIAMTVVSVGTSLPELTAHITASIGIFN